MSYKNTTISIKYDPKADREPWICAMKNQDIPLKGKEFTYNLGGLILYILDHLGHIPYSYVTLKVEEVEKKVRVSKERSEKIVEKVKKKSKVSKESLEKVVEEHEILKETLDEIVEEHGILKETLDEIVEEHNNAREEYDLTLKLNNVKVSRRLKKIEHYLRKRRKEKQKISS